jgi:hypothetical protein
VLTGFDSKTNLKGRLLNELNTSSISTLTQVLFLDQDLSRDLNHFPAISAGSQWDLQRSWTKNFIQDFGKKFSNFLRDLIQDLV